MIFRIFGIYVSKGQGSRLLLVPAMYNNMVTLSGKRHRCRFNDTFRGTDNDAKSDFLHFTIWE